jgi:hypothetical protein
VIVLLNCVDNTRFLNDVKDLFETDASSVSKRNQLLRIEQRPELMHMTLLASYTDNWRPYFEHLGSQFDRIVS